MRCPSCAVAMNNHVIDSRAEAAYIYRRRECHGCSHRWATYEVTAKSLEPFIELGRSLARVSRS